MLNKCDNTEPPNGLKKPKNGYTSQPNGNALISRDDKLILVPEPPTQQTTETTTEDAKGSDDESNAVRVI